MTELTPGTIVKLNFPFDPQENYWKQLFYERAPKDKYWSGFTHGIVVSIENNNAILYLFHPVGILWTHLEEFLPSKDYEEVLPVSYVVSQEEFEIIKSPEES